MQCIGMPLAFCIEQWQYRQVHRNKCFDKDPIVRIRLEDPLQIHWIEYGKEFILHHEMYDVKSMMQSKDAWILECIHDASEEDLILAYKTSNKKQSEKAIKKLYGLDFTNHTFEYETMTQWFCPSWAHTCPVTITLTGMIETQSPPPKQLIHF